MDYTRYAVQEHMKELHTLQRHEVTQMMYESAFLESCYQTGVIGVLEATKDSLFKDIIDAIKEFFASLKSKFKQRSIDLYSKKFDDEVIQKLKDNLGTLQMNAKKLSPRKMVPFWKGNPDSQSSAVVSSVTDAVNNVQSNDVKDYSYAKNVLGSEGETMLKNQDTAMSEYLKNYFRYGGVGDAETKKVTMSGSDIAGVLSDAISYIQKYVNEYAPKPGKMGDKLVTLLDRLKTLDVKESVQMGNLSPDTYLSVEEKYVCESLLPIMVNYTDVVTEAKAKTANNDKQTDQQKKVEKAKEEEKKNGESVTKANPVDPEKDEKAKEEAKNDPNSETKLSPKVYISDLNYFAKMAVTAYQTSIEERYLLYVDILDECGASEFMKKETEETTTTTTTTETNKKKQKKTKK